MNEFTLLKTSSGTSFRHFTQHKSPGMDCHERFDTGPTVLNDGNTSYIVN